MSCEEERRPGGRPDLLLAAERRLSQLQLSSEEVFRALHGSLSAVTLRHGCSSVARVGGLCTCQVTSWSHGDSTWRGVSDGAKMARGATFPVRSLAALLELIGAADGVVDYVKLDVESSEWGMFERLLAAGGGALGRVRQLAVELHLRQWEAELTGQGATPLTEARARRCLRVLFGLQLLGFQLAGSLHGESMCVLRRDDFCVSAAYETLWVNTNVSGVS
ncbi:uncharacterized protein LOC119094459 [Pollicipes pollicipes]|uniref:uncharacterized protein LOC119094459 n=1 Tax=Pollicipes pollicipes TaxID=41117 RepID=UPI001884EEB6|nr:uncharacterized protein LOC119094459 [Pollicipes pollicipes]